MLNVLQRSQIFFNLQWASVSDIHVAVYDDDLLCLGLMYLVPSFLYVQIVLCSLGGRTGSLFLCQFPETVGDAVGPKLYECWLYSLAS